MRKAMSPKSLKLPLYVIFSSLIACAASSAPARGSTVPSSERVVLDGTAYEVTLTFPGEPPVKDTLDFEAGRFESTACTSIGFPKWTEYRSRADGAAIAFEVATRHPEGTTMQWAGTVASGAAEGTAKRTMGGTIANGTFRGAVRKSGG
jgi:hypothetical protein